MTHPSKAQLRAYALGDLPDNVARATEAHLRVCGACREAVRATRDETVRLTDALPPAEPHEDTWRAVRRRTRTDRPRPWLAAAAVALIAVGGWGGWQAQMTRELRHDRQALEGWLLRPGVRALALTDRARRVRGRVLLAAGGTALFALPPPPPGYRYHAWVGASSRWTFGDPVRWVGSSADGVFEVAVGPTDYLCVSLERGARPERPTWARVVGFLFL